jgi:hypothetical protein
MTMLKLAVVRSYLNVEFPGARVTLADDAFTRSGGTVRFDITCQPDVAALEIARNFFKDRTPMEVSRELQKRRIDHFLRAHPESFVLLRRDDVLLR